MKNVKEIFLEEVKDKCSQNFGKYLFGEFRQFYGDIKEPDTNFEKNIFSLVTKFVRGEYVNKAKDAILIKAFKELVKCKRKYGMILTPNKTLLYRGLLLSIDGVKTLKFKKINNYYARSVDTYKYTSKSVVQSWTPNLKLANQFLDGLDMDDKNVPSIIEHDFKNDKELLFNTKFMNEVSTSVGFDIEDEIVRIDNKAVPCFVHILTDDLDDLGIKWS